MKGAWRDLTKISLQHNPVNTALNGLANVTPLQIGLFWADGNNRVFNPNFMQSSLKNYLSSCYID